MSSQNDAGRVTSTILAKCVDEDVGLESAVFDHATGLCVGCFRDLANPKPDPSKMDKLLEVLRFGFFPKKLRYTVQKRSHYGCDYNNKMIAAMHCKRESVCLLLFRQFFKSLSFTKKRAVSTAERVENCC